MKKRSTRTRRFIRRQMAYCVKQYHMPCGRYGRACFVCRRNEGDMGSSTNSSAGNDTIALLKECNSGIRLGINSLDDVMDKVKSSDLKAILRQSKQEHEKLGDETHAILLRYDEEGKEPHPMAKMMSTIKTGAKLAMDDNDQTVAELITDGCDMGIKSLNRYLNQYAGADKEVKEVTGKIITAEEKLRKDLWKYL